MQRHFKYNRLRHSDWLCAKVKREARAMTIMEMLVAMGILTVIVVGLLAMFQQTQRALRASMTQTDVMETGRAVMDLMTREIQQASAVKLPYENPVMFYGFTISNSINIFGITNSANGLYPPLSQRRAGGAPNRVYDFEDLFFIIRQNRSWQGIGYFVNVTNNSGVGTLYRYVWTTNHSGAKYLYNDFLGEKAKFQNDPSLLGTYKTHRVADGIVHLEAHFYDDSGVIYQNIISTNIIKFNNFALFMGNALPFTVEIEIGVLEPPVLERIKGMPGASVRAFLEDERRAGQVHLFRQRIPVRSATIE
ncbi:MAG: PilW family protein [Verrucomicrobiia bacterium]